MYTSNPYLNPFSGLPQQQQPIQNIFTNQSPMQSSEYFMARYLKAGETPQEAFVKEKTAFIDLNNKKLFVKEIDGRIEEYQIILPLDEKDRKIQELEAQINELKGMVANVSNVSTISSDEAINSESKQSGNAKFFNKK